MSQSLLIDIIIFGGIAALIVYRLISVLGKDVGHKKNKNETFINKREQYYQDKAKVQAEKKQKKGDKTVEQAIKRASQARAKQRANQSEKNPVKDKFSEQFSKSVNEQIDDINYNDQKDSDYNPRLTANVIVDKFTPALDKKIVEIKKIQPDFQPTKFLKAASQAFDIIYSSYVDGEIRDIKNICLPDIFSNLKKSIDERKALNERWFHQIQKIEKAQITKISLVNKVADISVKFTSIRSEAILDKDGKVISGSLGEPFLSSDVWTFRKDLSSKSPIWLLAAL